MTIKIDGFDDGFQGRVERQMFLKGRDTINAKLSKLWCEEHQRRPEVILTEVGNDLTLKACCEPMLKRAKELVFDAPPAEENIDAAASAIDNVDMPQEQPLVFISHSSADKDRFVRALEIALRKRGLRTWFDERDVLAGQNLVDRIFDQGLDAADAAVVVISANSVDRPWVAKELTTAVVLAIEHKLKALIPIRLDDVEMPVSLKDTKWIPASDPQKVDDIADQIAAGIFGVLPAPVAPMPAYAGIPIHRLGGLTPDDERVFSIACEQLLVNDYWYPKVQLDQVVTKAAALGMPEALVQESIAALIQNGWFRDAIGSFGEQYPLGAAVSDRAFESYMRAYRSREYRRDRLAIVASIVNDNQHSSQRIADTLHIHLYVVEHVLKQLEYAGHVKLIWHSEGASIRAELTLPRALRELQADVAANV